MATLKATDYPVIYYKLSSVLNKVTYAIVVLSPDSWTLYEILEPDGVKFGGLTKNLVTDPSVALKWLPSSTRNVLRESAKILVSASEREIKDFIDEIRSITWEEIQQAYKDEKNR